mgnify:CR=1 FL=1
MKCLFVAVMSKMSFGQRLMKIFVGPFWSEDVFPFVLPLCSPFSLSAISLGDLVGKSIFDFRSLQKRARGVQKEGC